MRCFVFDVSHFFYKEKQVLRAAAFFEKSSAHTFFLERKYAKKTCYYGLQKCKVFINRFCKPRGG